MVEDALKFKEERLCGNFLMAIYYFYVVWGRVFGIVVFLGFY